MSNLLSGVGRITIVSHFRGISIGQVRKLNVWKMVFPRKIRASADQLPVFRVEPSYGPWSPGGHLIKPLIMS